MSDFYRSMIRPQCVFLGNCHVNCMQALIAGVQPQLHDFLMLMVLTNLVTMYCLLKTSGMLMTAVCRLLRSPAAMDLQACLHVTQQLSSGQQPTCVSAHFWHAGGIWSMHCQGRSIATASKDCTVAVSSLDAAGSITAVQSYEQHAGAVKCVRWRDKHSLASCGNDM